MSTTIHALNLPRDNTRSTTHILWLRLIHRDNLEGPPSRFFRVADADVVAISEVPSMGKGYDREWKESIGFVSAMRKRSKLAGTGEVAAVVIECPPLGLQILPVGSLMDGYSKKEVFPNWKHMLIDYVEKGEKVLQFGF